MVSAGYKLALDDYVADERMRPLVELASIVKIDVLNRPHADLEMSPTIFGRAEFDSSPSASRRRRCATCAPTSDTSCFKATYSADRKR